MPLSETRKAQGESLSSINICFSVITSYAIFPRNASLPSEHEDP